MPLEDLEKELYKPESQNVPQGQIAEAEVKTSEEKPSRMGGWQEEAMTKKSSYIENKVSNAGRWVISAVVLFLVVLVGIGGYFAYQSYSVRDVALSVETPGGKVFLGVPFDVTVKFSNNAKNVLRDTTLSIELPDGISFVGGTMDQRVEERKIGDVGVGTISQEKFQVIATDNTQNVKRFRAKIVYAPPSIGSKFERSAEADVTIGESAISLDMEIPQKVFSGGNFDTKITYRNVSNLTFDNVRLKIEYPPIFAFKTSDIKPEAGNNTWNLGQLSTNSNGSITINGNVIGPEKSFFDIKASLVTSVFGKDYIVSSKAANLAISPSPLSLDISLNNANDYVANLNDNLNYTLTYHNNTDIGLRDVVIRAHLIGEMNDFTTLNTKAFFSSLSNTLTWNAANSPELKVLDPGASGTVNFSVRTKSTYPIQKMNDKNFLLKIEGQIESPTVPAYVAADKTLGLANFETKVTGHVVAGVKGYFYDAASGIVNKGSIPPRVNKPTQFTIHWLVTNYSTDVQNVVLSAFLQSGVKWTGVVKSNTSSTPTFNERTGEVTWNIDQVYATKGVISKPVEAIFQVEATPSINQQNNYMPLMSETTLKAFDTFINAGLTSGTSALSTSLPDDLMVGDKGIVK